MNALQTRQPRGLRQLLIVAVATLLLAFAGGLASPAPSHAQATCSKVYKAGVTIKQAPGQPPLVIGDSVTGFAIPALSLAGFRTNTQGCRSFAGAIKLLQKMRRAKRPLPRQVIIGTGHVGPVKLKQVRRTLRIIGKKRRLTLVTPRRLHTGKAAPGAKTMRRAARNMKRVSLVDWAKRSANRRNWFYQDMVHPNEHGVVAYTNMLSRAIFGKPFVPPLD